MKQAFGLLVHCGHDPFALWEVRTFAEIKFMVEVAVPYHMRPYEVLGGLLEGISGKKGSSTSDKPKVPQTPEEKDSEFMRKLGMLGFNIQRPASPAEGLVEGLEGLK